MNTYGWAGQVLVAGEGWMDPEMLFVSKKFATDYILGVSKPDEVKTEDLVLTVTKSRRSKIEELPKGPFEVAKIANEEIIRQLDKWAAELNYERAMKVVKPGV